MRSYLNTVRHEVEAFEVEVEFHLYDGPAKVAGQTVVVKMDARDLRLINASDDRISFPDMPKCSLTHFTVNGLPQRFVFSRHDIRRGDTFELTGWWR